MNIQYAMLGLLSFEPMTGYEIKKAMQRSPLTYWSGNNSQIYRTLAELKDDGLVSAEVLHGESAPTKKRYTITEAGRRELRGLSRAFPELPELRKPFLLQLAFGRDLSREELAALLDRYERELRGVLMTADAANLPGAAATDFESAVRELTARNIRKFYEEELAWAEEVRREALPLAKRGEQPIENGGDQMVCTAVNRNGRVYVTVAGGQIRTEQDGLDLVAACWEHETSLLLLPAACLSDDFLRLSTRVAGLVLQKLGNYQIKTAAVLDPDGTSARFREFLSESNQGRMFRAYADAEEAEAWLLGL